MERQGIELDLYTFCRQISNLRSIQKITLELDKHFSFTGAGNKIFHCFYDLISGLFDQ